MIGDGEQNEGRDGEGPQHDRQKALPDGERDGVRGGDAPVEMAIAEAEPLQPLLIAVNAEQDLVVALRIGRAEALDASGDDSAPFDPLPGIKAPAASRGVHPIDLFDERGIGLQFRLDQQAAHVFGNPIRQLPNRVRVHARIREIAGVERLTVHHRDARSERRLAVEVEADRHQGDAGARALGAERHPGRAGSQRNESPGRMADAFGENADRIAGGQRRIDRRKCLRVFRDVGSLIQFSIHGNRARSGHEEPERAVEQRRIWRGIGRPVPPSPR